MPIVSRSSGYIAGSCTKLVSKLVWQWTKVQASNLRKYETEVGELIQKNRDRFGAEVPHHVESGIQLYDFFMMKFRRFSKAQFSEKDRKDYLWLTPEFFNRYICCWMDIVFFAIA